jgi:tetratricopeptide (TPR) repeat protein
MRLFILALFSIFGTINVFAQDNFNLVAMGNQAMNEGRYRDAQEFYLAALTKEPQSGNIYTLLGFCYHKQRQYRLADSIFTISIGLDSVASKVYWYKGMNHIALKQDSLGIIQYKHFIRLEKARGGRLLEAYKAIGKCYERQLYKDGLYSWQIDEMLYYYELLEQADPSMQDAPLIKNFCEKVRLERPDAQVGKWKMVL